MNWPCDNIEPPERKDVPKWATLLAWVCLIALVSVLMLWIEAKAQEPLGKQIDWAPHPALGVVIAYEIDGQAVFYAHPVIAEGPVPECKQGVKLLEECKGVRVRPAAGAIHLMTISNEMPYLYVVDIIPTAKRTGDGEFTPIVNATFEGCE